MGGGRKRGWGIEAISLREAKKYFGRLAQATPFFNSCVRPYPQQGSHYFFVIHLYLKLFPRYEKYSPDEGLVIVLWVESRSGQVDRGLRGELVLQSLNKKKLKCFWLHSL